MEEDSINRPDQAQHQSMARSSPGSSELARVEDRAGAIVKEHVGAIAQAAEARAQEIRQAAERDAREIRADAAAAARRALERVDQLDRPLGEIVASLRHEVDQLALDPREQARTVAVPPHQVTGEPIGATTDPAFEGEAAEREAEGQREAEAEAERQREAEGQREAEAEAERQREAEGQREAEAEAARQREAEAEAARQREAEAEAERQREAEGQREAVAEAERQREAEAEQQRKAKAEAEAEAEHESGSPAIRQWSRATDHVQPGNIAGMGRSGPAVEKPTGDDSSVAIPPLEQWRGQEDEAEAGGAAEAHPDPTGDDSSVAIPPLEQWGEEESRPAAEAIGAAGDSPSRGPSSQTRHFGDDGRARLAEASDLGLAELYEAARTNAADSSEDDSSYWEEVARAAISEAAARPTFGDPREGEMPSGRRAKKRWRKTLKPLVSARNEALEAGPDAHA